MSIFRKQSKHNSKSKSNLTYSKWNYFVDKGKKILSPKKTYLNQIIIPRKRSTGFKEKIVKSFAWIALRIAINPTHWKQDKRKNREVVNRTYKRIVSKDFLFIPPAFAFYLIMAFMPIIFITLTIAGSIDTVNNFLSSVMTYLGLSGEDVKNLISIFNQSPSAIVLSIGTIILSFWIASAGFAKFVFTESHIYGHEKHGGYWENRFRGMVIVAIITIYITLIAMILSLIPYIIEQIGFKDHNGFGYNIIFWPAMAVFCFAFVYFGFVLLFLFTPHFKLTWSQVHPGSVVATVPTAGFILLFSLLTKYLFHYSSYGLFSFVMTVAISIFIVSYFIYVGLIANVVFYKVHHSKTTISKK